MPKYLTLISLCFSFSIIASDQQPSKSTDKTRSIETKTKTIKNKPDIIDIKQSVEIHPSTLLFIPEYLRPQKDPVVGC